jgi:hypothetical protein
VLAVLSQLSYSDCPVLAVLSCLYGSVLTVLFSLSFSACAVLQIIFWFSFWLSCSSCPFLAVLSFFVLLSYPSSPVLAALCLSKNNPVLAVLFFLSSFLSNSTSYFTVCSLLVVPFWQSGKFWLFGAGWSCPGCPLFCFALAVSP